MNIVSLSHVGSIMLHTTNYPYQYYKTETFVWVPHNIRNLCRICIFPNKCWGVLSLNSCWLTNYNPMYFLFVSIQNWGKVLDDMKIWKSRYLFHVFSALFRLIVKYRQGWSIFHHTPWLINNSHQESCWVHHYFWW